MESCPSESGPVAGVPSMQSVPVLSCHVHYRHTLFSHFLSAFPHLRVWIFTYNMEPLTTITYSMLAESIVGKREIRKIHKKALPHHTLSSSPYK
jgi:hypothetical protein